jgi:2-polyprenyl-3-methyl-5-hydroxy-6-metoxy-1,4-benzoquinol methylase
MSHVDYIYKNEDYIKNPKDQFRAILEWLKRNTDPKQKYELLDLGCARGELIHFLSKNIENIGFTGIDYSNDLIELATEYVNSDFEVADIESYEGDKKYDFVVISGVIEYLDDPSVVIKRIASHLRANGRCLVLNIFNEYDIDVRVRYRNNKYFNEFKNGWSLHSLHTFRKSLMESGFIIESEKKFFPECVLPPREDPARSWMVKLMDGTPKYMNGLSQIYDSYILEIRAPA